MGVVDVREGSCLTTHPLVEAAGGKVLGSVRHPLNNNDYSAFLLQAQASGAKVICFAPTLALAKKLIRSGVDALVIEGMEAGGHIGPVSTSVLAQEMLPEIAEALLQDRFLGCEGAAVHVGLRGGSSVRGEAALIDLTLADESPENVVLWAERLGAIALPTGSLRLTSHTAITELPGYADGVWWVQDAAAAIPARLFGDVAGQRVLDLCAAPGGKTAQLAARGATVTALDQSANRLKRLAANLDRLGLADRCETVAASLFDHGADVPFDAVLLDAPCSSTGTVRRHPDVPWTKTPDDIAKLAALQARMLERAADFVAPGGTLVFSNCSLDPSEGEDVARAFSREHANFEPLPATDDDLPGLSSAITGEGFVRTTPADLPLAGDEARLGGIDGFFAARWRRRV